MKWPFLLSVLLISIQGWCASSIPAGRIVRTATVASHSQTENSKQLKATPYSSQEDSAKIIMIGCFLVTYLTMLFWWASTTKRSLDNTLKVVLQDMARYP